jgi:hypothetical protein
VKSKWVEDVADPFRKKTIPFKTLESRRAQAGRIGQVLVSRRKKIFADLRGG